MNFKKWLFESMDVRVSEYEDQASRMDNLDDVANRLKKKILDPLIKQLPEEQKQRVIQKWYASHGIIAPDGSYYDVNPQYIINFYTEGVPDEYVDRIIKGIKYYLDEWGIKYGKFRRDVSGMFGTPVYRIPILQMKKTEDLPIKINLSNSNAHLIFGEILEYPGSVEGYKMSAADLLIRIGQITPEKLQIYQRDPYQRGNVFHGGLSDEDIAERLQKIERLARWAINNGYDQIEVV